MSDDGLVHLHRGCRLHHNVRGDGTAVLMIQGVGVHGDAWLPQVEGLASHHRCLWFDNRGLGRSVPAGEAVSVARMAEDAAALLDARGITAAHVVGHSLGGLVALELALTARARVRSLALLCTFACGPAVAAPRWPMLWIGLRTRVGTRRQRRRAFLELVMPPATLAAEDRDLLAERLAAVFGHDLADQPPGTMAQFLAMRAHDVTPRLGSLAGLPTLVVSATHDPIAPPAFGQALAAGIPGARYLEIADASHGLPIQHAGRVNDLLRAHFAAVDASLS